MSKRLSKLSRTSKSNSSKKTLAANVDLNTSADEFKPTRLKSFDSKTKENDAINDATTTAITTKAIIENESAEPSASQPFGMSEFGSSSTQERSRIENESKIDVIESETVITYEQAQESLSRLENILKKFPKSSN